MIFDESPMSDAPAADDAVEETTDAPAEGGDEAVADAPAEGGDEAAV